MTDPVLCPQGYSSERSAVEAWLEISETNPLTRVALTVDQLVPNRALKDLIKATVPAETPEQVSTRRTTRKRVKRSR